MNFQRAYGVAATLDGIPLVTSGQGDYKANPTLAAGDAKVSKDGGAFTDLATLPSVVPAGGRAVQVALSVAEMQATRIVVQLVDQTNPKEWEDQFIIVETVPAMAAGFQKNVAFANFTFFMADSADHVTGKVGLTISGSRAIDGGAFSGLTNGISEIANGFYKITLTSAELNGDMIALRFSAVGADATVLVIKTQP